MGSVSGVPVWAAELPFPPGPGWRAGVQVMCLMWVDGDLALAFSPPVSDRAETLASLQSSDYEKGGITVL